MSKSRRKKTHHWKAHHPEATRITLGGLSSKSKNDSDCELFELVVSSRLHPRHRMLRLAVFAEHYSRSIIRLLFAPLLLLSLRACVMCYCLESRLFLAILQAFKIQIFSFRASERCFFDFSGMLPSLTSHLPINVREKTEGDVFPPQLG